MTADHFLILIWNIKKDNQTGYFDNISKDYHILWDTEGNPYIINDGKVIITEKKIVTTAFSHLPLETEDYQNFHDIKYDQGYRVDSKNHNWLILKKYLSLSFSYMSFVIKEKIENND